MINDKDILVIYHGNCADGFSAAWCARTVYPNAEFYPAFHQTLPPDVTGKHVFVLDFSFKRDKLLKMAQQAQTITIIDHHKTAKEDLVNLPSNVYTMFDMNKSGAMLAWNYFNPGLQAPPLLEYIQDHDLFKHELRRSREVSCAVFSYPYDFGVWDCLMKFLTINELAAEGESILRKQKKDVDEMLTAAVQRMKIDDYNVPVINLTYLLGGEAATTLAIHESFAAYYWDIAGYRNFGLRSVDDGLDVSAIAVRFGGGGHKRAAGFKVKINQVKYDDNNLMVLESALPNKSFPVPVNTQDNIKLNCVGSDHCYIGLETKGL